MRSGSALSHKSVRDRKKAKVTHRRRNFKSQLERLEARLALTVQPFVGGDILIARLGDGSAALTNLGNPYFLDEYSPTGTLVQSIELPTSGLAPNNPIVNTGSGQVNGELTLSVDGRYVTFTGYDVPLPNLSNQNLKGSTAPRNVGRFDINGNLDTSTALSDYALGKTPGAAFSPDGNTFYVDTQSGAIRITTLGSSASQQVVNPSDPNFGAGEFGYMQLYNGQLYATDRSQIYQVGTGLPGAGSASLTPLPGLSVISGSNPNGNLVKFAGDGSPDFFFATLDPVHHGTQPDTLYFAQQANGGEIAKFSATFDNSGTLTGWSPSGYVLAPNVGGLTGYANGSTVVMFATAGSLDSAGGGTAAGGGKLYTYTDATGYNVAIPTASPNAAVATTLIGSLPSQEGFRGITLVPNQSPVLNLTGNSPLPILLENPVSNPGQLISGVISGLGASPITDTSAAQHQGIAITQADQTNGRWQFSLNGGTTWQNFPTVSSTAVLTLASDSSTRLRFVPNLSYNGSATITFRAWDQSQGTNGNTFDIADLVVPVGTSPFSSASASATQTITFVNQAPSFVRGPSQSILNTAGTQIVLNWATNVSSGAANESGQTLNFVVSNNNNGLFAVQPSIAVNGTLTYMPAANANGIATVSVQLHDNGGTANGGHDTSAAQTFQIAVTPVGGNQPPINTIPFAAQTTLENQPLTFSSANSNAISVSDPDAGSNPIQVAITVAGGRATLSTTNNLTPISGANGTASFTYQGTIANLNAALAGLIYTPTANINGTAAGQISIATNDLGSSGTGGAKTSTDTVTINIAPVNQPPAFTPGANITIPASGTPYSSQWATNISPGPANESGQSVAFVVTNDTPSAFLVQPSISPTGILIFTPVLGPAHTVQVTVTLQDSGGTDNGGNNVFTPAQPLLIQLTAVNVAPVNSVPGSQRDIENTPLVFSPTEFNALSVSDPDTNPAGPNEQVTLTAINGTFQLANLLGLTITASTGTAPNYSSITIQGNLTNLNKALFNTTNGTGLIFTPSSGFTGLASLTVTTDDLGNAVAPHLTATNTININVVPPPSLVISEIMANPPGTDQPNDYLEIRSVDTHDWRHPAKLHDPRWNVFCNSVRERSDTCRRQHTYRLSGRYGLRDIRPEWCEDGQQWLSCNSADRQHL